ncbi:MAG: recombinase family protein [Thermodesulfobacteriota bacterium]
MNGHHVGYIRVSTVDQHTDRQLDGLTLDRIFEEKVSGKDRQRPRLQECLTYLRHGDTLHVHSIDRLARNLLDLQQIIDELAGRGVAVRFVKEQLTFDGSGSPMQRLMLQLLGAFAEFERAMIRERQAEGIAAARHQGRHLGAPRALSDDQLAEIRSRPAESAAALAREYGVSRQTIYTIRAGKYSQEAPISLKKRLTKTAP